MQHLAKNNEDATVMVAYMKKLTKNGVKLEYTFLMVTVNRYYTPQNMSTIITIYTKLL